MQRKVFRIEQTLAERRAPASAAREPVDQLKALRDLGQRHDMSADQLKRELTSVNDMIAHNRRTLAALIGESRDRHMTRAAGELGAAIAGMEKATQKILHEAEGIDECARALGAALRTDYEHGLAQDIQEHTVRIYEACNFQDLAGQRIAKVIAMLNALEGQLATMLAHCNGSPAASASKAGNGNDLINGPKLDGDSGHASQGDIDAMFG